MYDVALLIERQLTDLDAEQVISLHEALDEPVAYHLVLPVDDAAAELTTSLGALGGIEMMGSPSPDNLTEIQAAANEAGQAELDASIALLQSHAQQVHGQLSHEQPVAALCDLVAKHTAAEAIVLTEPHIVAEFFRLDWTSRARRKLDVPILHLLEHETFAEQSSGYGEGATPI